MADLAAVRERFGEAKWIRWNIVRAVMSTAAFGCLTWALVLYGRVATQPALTPGTSEPGVPSRT